MDNVVIVGCLIGITLSPLLDDDREDTLIFSDIFFSQKLLVLRLAIRSFNDAVVALSSDAMRELGVRSLDTPQSLDACSDK